MISCLLFLSHRRASLCGRCRAVGESQQEPAPVFVNPWPARSPEASSYLHRSQCFGRNQPPAADLCKHTEEEEEEEEEEEVHTCSGPHPSYYPHRPPRRRSHFMSDSTFQIQKSGACCHGNSHSREEGKNLPHCWTWHERDECVCMQACVCVCLCITHELSIHISHDWSALRQETHTPPAHS